MFDDKDRREALIWLRTIFPSSCIFCSLLSLRLRHHKGIIIFFLSRRVFVSHSIHSNRTRDTLFSWQCYWHCLTTKILGCCWWRDMLSLYCWFCPTFARHVWCHNGLILFDQLFILFESKVVAWILVFDSFGLILLLFMNHFVNGIDNKRNNITHSFRWLVMMFYDN